MGKPTKRDRDKVALKKDHQCQVCLGKGQLPGLVDGWTFPCHRCKGRGIEPAMWKKFIGRKEGR